MTRKRISPAPDVPIRVTLITLDHHVDAVVDQARTALRVDLPGLVFSTHAAATFARDEAALARVRADIDRADILIVNMMFLDDQIQLILPNLIARRDACDAIVCTMSAAEVVKLTRLGGFDMSAPQSGAVALLKRLRGDQSKSSNASGASSGAGQMAMLRRLPKLLKFIPGKAQDVRAYFLTMLYWVSGCQTNLANMVRLLVDRYASGPRQVLRRTLTVAPPREYPEVGVYHPSLSTTDALAISDDAAAVPKTPGAKGVVGLVLLRSYILSQDADHYDGVIAALEARGLSVIPAFASGLDARPAIESFFMKDGAPVIDALVSLTGFSLVGGPAYNDAKAAEAVLRKLDVPYLAAHPTEFQSLQQWGRSGAGLTPVEQTIMIAIPELEGATAPTLFAGRASPTDSACEGCDRHCTFPETARTHRMRVCGERAEALAARVARLVALRRKPIEDRKVAIVLFNYPPNAGAAGTAAHLAVLESLHATLTAMAQAGYGVTPPASVEALRAALLDGNAQRYNTDANVAARVDAADIIRTEPHLNDIERQWGPAPGRHLTDGRAVFVLGAAFGNVFVGLQPAFGVEGDPMRLMFEGGFAPTHAFAAFYRYLQHTIDADVIVHFGTHGALEFMPGKHAGLSAQCWPERLIGDRPNINLYAANNPSEGAIAKRRAAATLVSYLTPPLAQAGLHQALADLRDLFDRWRSLPADAGAQADDLLHMLEDQARAHGVWAAEEAFDADRLGERLYDFAQSLIPEGLHVLGQPMPAAARATLLEAIAAAEDGPAPARTMIDAVINGASNAAILKANGLGDKASAEARLNRWRTIDAGLKRNDEIDAVLHAIGGGYIAPAPGGDVMRTPELLPTGRNLHGFDPFRLPSAYAMRDGALQAERLLQRHLDDHGVLPRSVAFVLWGTDALKTEGAPVAQALALMGAKPRLDAFGRVCGAALIDLQTLGRPRIDVVMTLSGIFRDLLPLQTRMLAEAAYLAACADEPEDQNFVRKHSLAMAAANGLDLETAALRVFSNAEGAYGANVNQLIDSAAWDQEDELADAFQSRKGFAYGRTGAPRKEAAHLQRSLATVDCAYQNLDSLELGVTSLDQYVDTLGGVSRLIARAKGSAPTVYIGDSTQAKATVRSLQEQVTLETHTRTLNPRWFEALLKHGHEGVRQIEAQVTAMLGWSATTGNVPEWVYQKITETYVLDDAMRERLAALNPKASARLANRLIEATQRRYWAPDANTLNALRSASADIEDRLEGIAPGPAPSPEKVF